jgi:hypothetical protein
MREPLHRGNQPLQTIVNARFPEPPHPGGNQFVSDLRREPTPKASYLTPLVEGSRQN